MTLSSEQHEQRSNHQYLRRLEHYNVRDGSYATTISEAAQTRKCWIQVKRNNGDTRGGLLEAACTGQQQRRSVRIDI